MNAVVDDMVGGPSRKRSANGVLHTALDVARHGLDEVEGEPFNGAREESHLLSGGRNPDEDEDVDVADDSATIPTVHITTDSPLEAMPAGSPPTVHAKCQYSRACRGWNSR